MTVSVRQSLVFLFQDKFEYVEISGSGFRRRFSLWDQCFIGLKQKQAVGNVCSDLKCSASSLVQTQTVLRSATSHHLTVDWSDALV